MIKMRKRKPATCNRIAGRERERDRRSSDFHDPLTLRAFLFNCRVVVVVLERRYTVPSRPSCKKTCNSIRFPSLSRKSQSLRNFVFADFCIIREKAERGSEARSRSMGGGEKIRRDWKKLSCVNWASMTRWKTMSRMFRLTDNIGALSSFRGRDPFRFPIASCEGKKKEVGMSRWSVIGHEIKTIEL